AHRENHSGLCENLFAFPPESPFTFSPESFSSSPRNAFHVHPGILFTLPRNPQRVPAQSCARPASRSDHANGAIPTRARTELWTASMSRGCDGRLPFAWAPLL